MTIVNICLVDNRFITIFNEIANKIKVVFKIRKCITNLCAAQIGIQVPLAEN